MNNESSELIEMLNSAFDEWATAPGVDLNPPASRATQAALNEAHTPLRDALARSCAVARPSGRVASRP